MTAYVKNPDFRILTAIVGTAAHFGKMWCFPSQRKLLEMLRVRFNYKICRRTLNSHLGAFERDGYIQRHRRHKKDNTGALELHSTVYALLAKTIRYFGQLSKFQRTAAAHPWAKLWINAVQNRAQRMDQQTDIMAEAPKKRAPFGQNAIEWLRHLRKT